MFLHNLKYTLKTLFRNKMLIFWTFAFPLILGLFFNMAFSDLENSESFHVIDIAIVDNPVYQDQTLFKEVMDQLSDPDNENQMFSISMVSEKKAKNMLEDKEISAYIEWEKEPSVYIASNGMNETIVQTTVDEILQSTQIVTDLIETKATKTFTENPMLALESEKVIQEIQDDVVERLQSDLDVTFVDQTSAHLSYTMVEFFTLIAMTCLYGGILSMTCMNQTLANMSHQGKRIAVSPTQKFKLVLSSVLASYLAQLVGVALLFAFTIFVLHVDYGSHVGHVILLAMVGSLAGLAMGIMVGSVFKYNENIKTGILSGFTMLGCFLSGMMGVGIKYVVDTYAPLVNRVNPANMITDGLYSLYYYSTFDRYWLNIISLLIFSAILIGISMVFLRRQRYDSI